MAFTDDDVVDPAGVVAQQLDLSKATLARMRQCPDAAGLPFVQLGANRIGYTRRDVRAFLAARRVGALSQQPVTVNQTNTAAA